MFGDINQFFEIEENDNILIQKDQNLTIQETIVGEIPVVAGGKVPSCYHNKFNRGGNIISVSSSGANAGYINYWSKPMDIYYYKINQVKKAKNISVLNLFSCHLKSL